MPNEKLKPCPFCGGNKIKIIMRIETSESGFNLEYNEINCKCGIYFGLNRSGDISEAWNRRVEDGQKSTG